MASSVSEREEQNPSMWLATRAHDGVILPVRDYPLRPATPESSVFFPYNISSIDQACPVKMAG